MNHKVTILAFIVLISVSMLVVSAQALEACSGEQECIVEEDDAFVEKCGCAAGKICAALSEFGKHKCQ